MNIICDSGTEDMLYMLVPLQGMVQAAEYIHSKLVQEDLLEKAFNWRVERVGCDYFNALYDKMFYGNCNWDRSTSPVIPFWDRQWWGRRSLNYYQTSLYVFQGTDKFALVCVGHSLGGGTAAILAIILRCWVENHQTFCFWWFCRKPSELLFLMISPLTRAHAILITTCDPPT